MKKRFSDKASLARFLMGEVMRTTDFFDQGFICLDFIAESEKISYWLSSDEPRHDYPYYVCIRRYGVEVGPKSYAEYRCSVLKDVVNVYVIHKCGVEFDVEIRERI